MTLYLWGLYGGHPSWPVIAIILNRLFKMKHNFTIKTKKGTLLFAHMNFARVDTEMLVTYV